jgi:hypothetical protein
MSSQSQDPLMIRHFSYPPMSLSRINDNKEMARLHYMTSRIRAALCVWGSDTLEVSVEGSDEWWWTGLQIELVRIKEFLI